MIKGGVKASSKLGRLITVAMIACGLGAIYYALHRSSEYPSTDAATIDADLVHVASPVGGRIVQLNATENATVNKGDLLFQIDPVPFQLAVTQAEADLALAKANLETKRRLIADQYANAAVTAKQVGRAQQNYELATRTVERLRPLVAKGYVPAQQFDQAEVAQHDAAVSLAQAKEQRSAAAQAVDTLASAEAGVQAREAALAVARHTLADATVRAPITGRVVGLTTMAGEVVAPSQSLFILINIDEWFTVANFRETELKNIKVGDCATVYSMIDRRQSIRGTVVGLGAGVLDTERVALPRALPYIERSLNWVRVAQRFPVRIALLSPPQDLMRGGASAVVEVKSGPACN